MSAEGFIVSNPKDNNKDLRISFEGRNGQRKTFKTLRPGAACRVDKKIVQVEEVTRPLRLNLNKDGSYSNDSRRSKADAL